MLKLKSGSELLRRSRATEIPDQGTLIKVKLDLVHPQSDERTA